MTIVTVAELVHRAIQPTRQQVTMAKDYVVRSLPNLPGRYDTSALLSGFVQHLRADPPSVIEINQPVEELERQTRLFALSVSAELALAQATWELIGAGIVVPVTQGHYTRTPMLKTITTRNGSSSSNNQEMAEFLISLPQQVMLGPAYRRSSPEPFVDGDLYLRDLNVPGLNAIVEEALRQAIACFRADLYLPCLAMLARGSEGAWSELAAALAAVAKPVDAQLANQLSKVIPTEKNAAVGPLITLPVERYRDKPVFRQVESACGVSPDGLWAASRWSNEVRDARNVLHLSHQPALPNTYEKVGILLMAGTRSLKAIYGVTRAAQALVTPA